MLPLYAFLLLVMLCPSLQGQSIGVCTALQTKGTTKNVLLRATGTFLRIGEQAVADSSCLRGTAEKFTESGYLSSYISIRTDFGDERSAAASRFRFMTEQHPGSLFQILATGDLTCRPVNRHKDAVVGNGFGRYGRMPCEFLITSIHRLEVIQWGQ
jgi:hypothetical protein